MLYRWAKSLIEHSFDLQWAIISRMSWDCKSRLRYWVLLFILLLVSWPISSSTDVPPASNFVSLRPSLMDLLISLSCYSLIIVGLIGARSDWSSSNLFRALVASSPKVSNSLSDSWCWSRYQLYCFLLYSSGSQITWPFFTDMWPRACAITRSDCMSLSRSYTWMPVAYRVQSDLTRVQVLLVRFYKGSPIIDDSDSSLDEFCFLGAKKVEIMLCLIDD